MNGRVLLDTNIVIALFANETVILQRLAATDEVFVPSIVLGELYFGAYKSVRADENIARINEFAADNTVLSCQSATAQRYGVFKHQLRSRGNPISENDIWIAAIAMQYQLTLVTRDAHFQTIDGLMLGRW